MHGNTLVAMPLLLVYTVSTEDGTLLESPGENIAGWALSQVAFLSVVGGREVKTATIPVMSSEVSISLI